MAKRVLPVRPFAAGQKPRNQLLARLPAGDFERLRSELRPVRLQHKQVLQARNEPIRQVFFLNGGVGSLTTVTRDGRMVEIGTVGDEGVVGVNAFLAEDMVAAETMLQVPDEPETTAEMMTVQAFRRELDVRGSFYACIQRYMRGLHTLMMQSTACLAFHPVQQRCCRWLLMTHDRVRRDEFILSQEFMAMMLGVSRPTVTVVAGTLQKAGLIRYTHGRIRILDREGLEAASCECYGTVREHFERLGLTKPRRDPSRAAARA
jgi:CRP-like cAMP-binding protein